ncbi:zinc-binding dehydrogenase [Agrococcus sp. HG114]|uniref:zinc-binding dehydrogenase n=1 Tax=Agrococcus sp. HG114 TaxID=2969757 RepID=UPI00215AE0F9|nr:zinc-binding dehydrogenase [Agrococcus sp. HG114]MCR8671526.1 zinc-binding dehydrogenase [Agrococcus sp. HG114]
MRATILHGPGDIRVEEWADPSIERPTDAIVRVVAGCVCGSDLWPYRGANAVAEPRTIGHEAIGVVEAVGPDVARVRVGDFVIVPFDHCCGRCAHCLAGQTQGCVELAMTPSGQAELTRVTNADATCFVLDDAPAPEQHAAVLVLSDVLPTGYHAAVSAGVAPGSTAVVVGDGAVGLCGVLSARRLGAERIVVLSRNPDRQRIATAFGATDVVAERGDAAVEAVRELTGGVGADAVLECVGTAESMGTAFGAARPGATVGFVGVPHGVEIPWSIAFRNNIGLRGGMAPVVRYLPELVPAVLAGDLDASAVFDLELPLDEAAEAYRAMDERRAVKVLLRP